MIDLTPLDVRKKRGDFRRTMRGYDPQEVDFFLEVVAERMEALVKENLALQERSSLLGERVVSQEGREKAVNEALVTAQELREEIRSHAQREAELIRREAEANVETLIAGARRKVDEFRISLADLERQRTRFLKGFRTFLEREMDGLEVEESRAPLEDVPLDLDLLGGSSAQVRSLSSLLEEGGGSEVVEPTTPLRRPAESVAKLWESMKEAPESELFPDERSEESDEQKDGEW